LLILHARLVDGSGRPPVERASIVVRDGRIAAIAEDMDLELPGAPVLDAKGATVLPGLIDSHVHLAAAPGSAFRNDSDAKIQELNHEHLRAYLANGVTTVLDPGSPMEMVEAAQRWLAAGNPGPRYLTTGPVLRVPGGYGSERHGALRSVADVERALDRIVAMGGAGVKLATESAFGPFASLPQFPPEMRRAILDGASRRKLPLYIHAMNERDGEAALDLGAHAIMHAPIGGVWTGQFFGASDLSDGYVRRLARSGAYQLTTFSVLDTWPGSFDVRRLDDPMVILTVPRLELATARNPEAERFFAVAILGQAVPWLPESALPWVARHLWDAENLREGLAYSQRNILRLHRAGVPIVAATDAPSTWPEAIYHFHGPQTPREVELLVDAGLSPMEAIVAATRNPARMLGLEDEIGTVEVGKRADL
ncbi:MAG: amidohydrolase family protein, partial [Candidatus Binatia bacterium]